MKSGSVAFDDSYAPNKWIPAITAISFHWALMAWNPIVVGGASFQNKIAPLEVIVRDQMPVIEVPKPPPPPPKPVKKKVEKPPVVKKMKKAGLEAAKKPAPIAIAKKKTPAPPVAAPKPFVSKVSMPKFTPRASDEMLAASPAPGMSAPARTRMERGPAPAPVLKGKTRGIRATDVNFELTDRGTSLAGAAARIVAIPLADESGDEAVLPSAQVLHDAPKGIRTKQGYRYQPGTGSGSGELAGRDKGARAIGFHGVVKADSYQSGGMEGGSGGTATKVIQGRGFEMAGPVGDRKVLKRKLPEYPEWAEEKGITAMVKIHFTVKPDGTIRPSMRILQSSGYTDLDQLAKDALRTWRFSPTAAHSSEEEAWGIISFRFTLG